MLRVSVYSLGRGVGKTTLATCLAVKHVSLGGRAAILSLDYERVKNVPDDVVSLSLSGGDRNSLDVKRVEEILSFLQEKYFVDLVLMDTLPGGLFSTCGVVLSDFVLVPTRPSEKDITMCMKTLFILKKIKKRCGVVLNMVPLRALAEGLRLAKKMEKAIEAPALGVVPYVKPVYRLLEREEASSLLKEVLRRGGRDGVTAQAGRFCK